MKRVTFTFWNESCNQWRTSTTHAMRSFDSASLWNLSAFVLQGLEATCLWHEGSSRICFAGEKGLQVWKSRAAYLAGIREARLKCGTGTHQVSKNVECEWMWHSVGESCQMWSASILWWTPVPMMATGTLLSTFFQQHLCWESLRITLATWLATVAVVDVDIRVHPTKVRFNVHPADLFNALITLWRLLMSSDFFWSILRSLRAWCWAMYSRLLYNILEIEPWTLTRFPSVDS